MASTSNFFGAAPLVRAPRHFRPRAHGGHLTRLRASDTAYEPPLGVNPASVVSVFRVPPELAGQRVDLFVMGQLHRTSRSRTQAIVLASAYDEDGRRVRPGSRVRAEQKILLWRPPWDETPVPTEIPILYEDAHLLAVDKPALLPVHPSARYHKNTLIKLLQSARPGEFLSLGHRLDRETSGVLLVSKSAACDRALKRMFEFRENVDKVYGAITWGVPRGAAAGATLRHAAAMRLDPGSSTRLKMQVTAEDAEGALAAATRFTVVGIRRRAAGVYAHIRCELETGRQHQIRVHLSDLGAPIVGDKLYGPDEGLFSRGADGELTSADSERLELPRHALHAACLRLSHPITREPLVIEAPFPTDLRLFWAALGVDGETP